MGMLAAWFIPFLFLLIWLGVAVYVLMLVTRLVRAAERIAEALERNPPAGR
jgi:hypothetical protein